VRKPRAGLEMERVADYASSKGVGLRLWVHWKPLSEHLEEAFAQYEKWGIQGLMVDFLDRDDQEMVLFAERVLQSAARHHLHINFHGVWKPTGLQRTYPNLANHEGVLNLEYLKWSDQCGPEHSLIVAFTRQLAGPMDYHLGGFRAVPRGQFKPLNIKPNVLGTRCHHLAMYVVFENPLPMVSDAPTAYEGQPGFDFIRQVPSNWDETRVLSGQVGNYIVVARRQGSNWYVGAMTDWTPRTLDVPLSFLSPGQFQVETWADATDSEDPNQLVYQTRTMAAADKLEVRLRGGGGQATRIRPATQ
jgi:alpha-glucosidase